MNFFFPTDTTPAELTRALSEVQNKLSAALANIELHKEREAQLFNQIKMLQATLGQLQEGENKDTNKGLLLDGHSQPAAIARAIFPVEVVENNSKVPAQLLVLEDALEVVVVKARVDYRSGASMVEEQPEFPKSPGKGVHKPLLARQSAPVKTPGGSGGRPLSGTQSGSKEVPHVMDVGTLSLTGNHVPPVMHLMWRDAHTSKRQQIKVEGPLAVRDAIRKQLDTWAAGERATIIRDAHGSAANHTGETFAFRSGQHATPLTPYPSHPGLSSTSDIISREEAACVASCMPRRERLAQWRLAYSTKQHGISLNTFFRAAMPGASVLVIKDSGGAVFGAFCTEQWRVAPRYYGTGTSFVFQLKPKRVAFTWHQESKTSNDYFQLGNTDGIGIGGAGHYAIHLDSELLMGSSGESETFLSTCLASKGEFHVKTLELWSVL